MTAGAAAIVASAVVRGRPTWSPEVIAALARMFHDQRTAKASECTPVLTASTTEAADVR